MPGSLTGLLVLKSSKTIYIERNPIHHCPGHSHHSLTCARDFAAAATCKRRARPPHHPLIPAPGASAREADSSSLALAIEMYILHNPRLALSKDARVPQVIDVRKQVPRVADDVVAP